MGNSARKVAAAEAGSVRRKCPRAWAVFMGLVGLEGIDHKYAQSFKVLFITGCNCQPVHGGGRSDHAILAQGGGLPRHEPRPLAKTGWVHGQESKYCLDIVQPIFNLACFGGVLPA